MNLTRRQRAFRRRARGRAPGQILDLPVRIPPIQDTAQVEHLGAVVDLGPKAMLEALLLSLESRGSFDEVEVGEDRDDLGQAMGREGRQDFESFLRRP